MTSSLTKNFGENPCLSLGPIKQLVSEGLCAETLGEGFICLEDGAAYR